MIALYTRVSTSAQAQEGYSLEEQEKRLRAYCELYKLEPVRVYCDPGFSGSNLDRPAMQQLIKDVKKGLIEKVVVWKLDRLSRNQLDTLRLIEEVFLPNGTEFVSATENFDTSTPIGRATLGLLSTFAQLERSRIQERMVLGKDARAKAGKFHGTGMVPIGYDYIDGELVINWQEAAVVRRIFDEYASGRGVTTIWTELDREGLQHKRGKYTRQNVSYILKNRLYVGEIKNRDRYFPGKHEPIIDRGLFEDVQARLLRTKIEFKQDGKHHGRSTHEIGGLVYCGCCGAKYGADGRYFICNSRRKKNPYCVKDPNCKNKSWRIDTLTDMVLQSIVDLKIDEYAHELYEEELAKNRREPTPKALQKDLSKVERQISRLMDLYSLGDGAMTDVVGKLKALQERKKALEIQIEELQAVKADTKAQMKAAKRAYTTSAEIIASGCVPLIQEMVRLLVSKIVIRGDDVEIYWTFM